MPIAWSPPDRYLTRSRLRRFAAAHGHEDFGSLHRWSVEDQDGFWRAVDRDLGLVWRTPYRHVLDVSRGLPWTTWWLGGRMNYVESALRHDAARTAIIFEGEEGTTERLSYGELAARGRRHLQAGLFRLRERRDRGTAPRCGGDGPHHRGWIPSPRSAGANERDG